MAFNTDMHVFLDFHTTQTLTINSNFESTLRLLGANMQIQSRYILKSCFLQFQIYIFVKLALLNTIE